MRKLLLSLALVAVVGTVSAQSEGFGLKAGLNMSSLGGDDVNNSDSKIGFNVGAFYNLSVSENFAIQPEAGFSTEGDKDIDFSNIYVTGLAKMYFSDFSIEAGPQLNFYSGDDADALNVESMILSLNVGAGYNLSEQLAIGARYGLGMSDLVDNVSVKQNNISLNIFFNF